MSAVITVFSWELRKLAAQKRTYIGLAAAAVYALAFVITLSIQSGGPTEEPFGALIRTTGLALPLVLLTFASVFGAPLVVALVAGDIVATEDTHATLKTITTRSVSRTTIYTGKALAAGGYCLAALATLLLTSLIAASIAWGLHPLENLSGETLPTGEGLALVALAYAVFLLPVLVIAALALLLSTVTRNSAAALVGALLAALGFQLLAALPGIGAVGDYLLPQQFEAWQGLFRSPIEWERIVRAAIVCPLLVAALFAGGLVYFRRRDIAGD